MQLASIFKDMKESSFMLADVAPFFPIFYSRFFIFEASAIMEARRGVSSSTSAKNEHRYDSRIERRTFVKGALGITGV
jgi:hypothetical protein